MLNKEQEMVVNTLDKNLLVIAGAGTGKTRCITHRAIKIASMGVEDKNILIVTFTNKATNELKNRLKKDSEPNILWRWVGTFHSICAKFLRIDGEKIELEKNFTIIDAKDQKNIVKEIMKKMRADPKKISLMKIIGSISSAKNKLIEPSEFFKFNEDSLINRTIASIYREYQEFLHSNNSLDFDDLLMKTTMLLSKVSSIRKKYQKKFKYIMIDEFQDTNLAQYKIIKLLCGAKQNICVVGDDDQSIYSWRGANVENILNFNKDFPNSSLIKLEQNYRSTKEILNLANSLIEKNPDRYKKNLFAKADFSGNLPEVKAFSDEYIEAKVTTKDIQKISDYENTAILYRINSQSRIMESILMESGVPYEIKGGTEFFIRKEIKDIISYLKFVYNPKDFLSLKRIINVPTRGIGKVTSEKIIQYLIKSDTDFFSILENDDLSISESIKNNLSDFIEIIQSWHNEMGSVPIHFLVKDIIEKIKIIDFYDNKDLTKDFSKGENIKEFLLYADHYASDFHQQHNDFPLLVEFLEKISLQNSLDDEIDENTSKVKLMTIHNAKGLEFENVFIIGVEEGILPHQLSIAENQGLQEERRLLYVAMTRAKKKLQISFCKERRRFAHSGFKTSMTNKSRFLDQVDKRLYKSNLKSRSFVFGEKYGKKEDPLKELSVKITSEKFYKKDDEIIHKKFGLGKIIDVNGTKEDAKLTISFNSGQLKKIIGTYVKKIN